MKIHHRLRPWLLFSLGLPFFSANADVVKTWDGDNNNALNNVLNWNGDTRPIFGATANTDALLFTGLGVGIVNVNVDATSKSIHVSGALGYTFQGANPLRLGDTTTTSVQPNTGFFTNASTANLALTTTGGVFFSFGKLDAAASTISVGANSFLDIGNGAATAGRNLTITGANDVTVNGIITGLGTQTSAGGHLYKTGASTLILSGSSAGWDGRIFLNEGNIRINRASSLGSASGDTTLGGGDSTSRIEITGSIAVDETFITPGRNSAESPLFVNTGGNNVLSAPLLLNAGGSEFSILSQAGSLTFLNDISYGTQTGPSTLNLQGDGQGHVIGDIGTGGSPLGIVKSGAGTWSLNGANAFTGHIHVLAGQINLTTNHTATNAVTVDSGARLGVAVAAANQSLNTSSLNLTGVADSTALAFDLGAAGNPSAPVLKATSLTVTGVVGVSLKGGGGLSIGQIPLIDYDGSIGGTGFSAFQLTKIPARITANLVDDIANSRVLLNVTAFDIPKWTGEISAIWDSNDGTGTGTANWKELISGSSTRYLQTTAATDSVRFDDSAPGSTQLQLEGSLTPASILVDNTTKDYSFNGTGSIAGDTSLTKKGTGKLTFLNSTANTFSGSVSIEAGTLQVGDGITVLAGSLGTGSIANSGTLVLNRPDAYTLSGAISGGGAVIKRGAGITTLSGNSSFSGSVTVSEGTLRLANAKALGNAEGATFVSSGAALELNGQLLASEVVHIIGGGLSDSGALVNTGTGGVGVGLKKLILDGPSVIGGNTRWDIRESEGGVNVQGHDLTKTGTNVITWHNVGETHIGNLFVTGASGRFTLSGNTTAGNATGEIHIAPGAQFGLEDSTVPVTKTIRVDTGTINATGGTTNVVSSTIHVTGGLTVNSAASTEIVIAGKITGDGSLTKTTGGIVKITNDNNDYTGTTTISQGAFWIGNDGPTGKLPAGDIINNGNLIFRRSGTPLVVSQTISGTGQITLPNAIPDSNDYILTLSGNNSFNGNVTIRRAFLRITNSHALGATLPPPAEGEPAPTKIVDISTARRPTLLLDGTSGDIDLAPTIHFTTSSDGPTGSILNEAGNNIIRGNIDLVNASGGNTRIVVKAGTLSLAGIVRSAATATSNRTLFLEGDGTIGYVNGTLATGGPFPLLLTKQGTGTWVLNGTNTYTGLTTIAAGTLKIGATGSIANTPNIDLSAGAFLDVTDVAGGFVLRPNQSLRGQGDVTGSLVLGASSTLNPGPGAVAATFNISQNLTFQNTGRLLVNLNAATTEGAGVNDLVNVAGNLNVEGAGVIELASTGTIPNGIYRLINYGGTLVGSPASLVLTNPTRKTATLDTATTGQVNLVVGGAIGNLTWAGNGTTNVWDFRTSTSWNAGAEIYHQSDAVVFNDSSANVNVALTGTLTPSSVLVDTAQNYVFGGTGTIGGVTGLTKSGLGSLTLTTAHGFTGKVKIAGGSLILGLNGRLNGTRWIDLDAGTTLDVSAITAGFTYGGTILDQRVISGTGTLNGNYILNSAAVIKPGSSSNPDDILTAGDGIGSLTFGGNLTLAGAALPGSPRAVLRLAGPTAHVVDPLDFPTVTAFGTTVPTQHDHIAVLGTLSLDAGSTIKIELAEGFTPVLGDVFNIADWGTLITDTNADGTGFNPALLTDLDLPELPEGLYWNRRFFSTDGILFISQGPPVIGALAISPNTTVNPGTAVTLSTAVTGLTPYTYQWQFNQVNVEGATEATYTFNATTASQGSYSLVVTNPAGTTTSQSAVLTVNKPVQFVTNLQNRTVNPDSDVFLSVQVTGTGPFTYQWRKNGANLEGETEDTLSLLSVTNADEGNYDVVVTNIVGSQNSAVSALTLNKPVTIIQQPLPQGASAGGNATFSVQVSGTAPFTYRWRKNGVDIAGETAALPNFTLNNVTATDEGNYSVRVTNSIGSVTSADAGLYIAGSIPRILSLSPHQLSALGSNITLQVNAIAQSALSYQWFRDGATVAGATGPQLKLNNAQIKAAGSYTVSVTANGQTVNSDTATQVSIVDTAWRNVALSAGGAAKLDVKTGGSALTFAWTKDGVPLEASGRIIGVDQSILSIAKPVSEEDSGLYQLTVTGPGGTLTTEGHKISIFSEPPVITENPPVFPAAIVGGDFTPYIIPVDPDAKKAPTGFAVSGLPPGLKLDNKTGRITGRPTTVSKDPQGYLVKLTASNSKGKSIVEGRLVVQQLPANVIGSFAAPLPRNSTLNGGLGGLLEITVASKGTYTGKLLLGSSTLPVKGALLVTAATGETASTQTVQQTIIRKGLSSLDLALTFDPQNNRISAGTLTDGTETIAITGWRNVWSKTNSAITQFGGYQTFALDIPEELQTNLDVPQGNGYGAITVKIDGKLSIAGKLADGEALTGAGFTGPNGEIALYRTLYKTKEKGSIQGQLALNTPNLTGEATWTRPVNPSAKHRVYQAGFPGVVNLTASGGQYNAPTGVFLDLQAGAAAELSFNGAGLESWVTNVANLDIALTIGAKSKPTLTQNAEGNPRKVSLALTDKKGLFKGGFSLELANPVASAKPPLLKQNVKFEGIAVRQGTGLRGAGFFLLQQLPTEAVPANTPILSGQVSLEANP